MVNSPDFSNKSPDQHLYLAYRLPTPDRMRRFCLSEPDRHDFFMAYTFQDVGMVRALDEAIRNEGFKSWIGDLEALVSQGYKANVDRGIRDSDGFVLLAGADAAIPDDLYDELKEALELNKLVFLLARQPLSAEQLRLPQLQGLQWASLAHMGSSYGFNGVARTLVHSLTYVRLLARALEWERQNYPNQGLLSLGDLQATQTRLTWIQHNLGDDFAIQPIQRQFLEASEQHIKTGDRTDYFQGKPPDVFISYSSKDREFVKQLATMLEDKKLECWVDWENIPIATNWRNEVAAGIRAAHTFLFVISPHSVWSEHCKWELEQARQCNRRTIPICCGQNYHPQRLESLGLGELSYVSFEELEFEVAANKVVTAIRTDLEDVKAYNWLYGKAYEWQIHQRDTRLLMDRKDFQRVQDWIKDRRPIDKRTNGQTQFVQLHPLQEAFVKASRQTLQVQRQQRWLFASFILAGFGAALAIAAYARLGEVKALVASLEEKVGLDGLITALHAGKRLEENFYLPLIQPDLPLDTTTALHQETLSVRELNRLEGHARGIYDVAFSPNGEMLVSAGEDGTVRPWTIAGPLNATSESQNNSLDHDGAEVTTLDYSADGDFFVTGGIEGAVKIWSCDLVFRAAHSNTANLLGRPIADIRYDEKLTKLPRYSNCSAIKALEHPGRVVRVAVSPGSQYVASASYGGNVHLWTRADSFAQPQVLTHPAGRVFGLDFSMHDRLLVSSDQTGTIRIWDINQGTERASMVADTPAIDVRFSRDGRFIAIGGLDGLLQIWDWANNRSITLPGHEGDYVRVMFSPKNNYLASADTDGIVNLWNITDIRTTLNAADPNAAAKQIEPTTLRGHQDAINRIQFSADGRYLASASLDDTVRIWLTADGALLDTITGHQDEVQSLSFSPPVKTNPYNENEPGVAAYLATSSRDSTIRLWRINNQVRPLPHDNRIYDIAFRPDGRILASAGRRNISLWRLSDYERVSHIAARKSGDIYSVHYSPGGDYLVAGDSTGKISLWQPEVNTERPLRQWPEYPENSTSNPEVSTVRFNPTAPIIASGWSDGAVKFWNLNGDLLGQETLPAPVTSLAFSPQGDRLAVSTRPDPTDDSQPQQGQILIYDFSANSDGQIELTWQATANAQPTHHQEGILTVAFNPANANQLASGGEDGQINLWRGDGSLLKTLKGHSDAITRIDYSADGDMLVSSSRDSTVKLWRVAQGDMVSSMRRHKRQVAKVLFNPLDETVLASAGFDDQVLMWSLPANLHYKPLRTLVKEGCQSAERYLNHTNAIHQQARASNDYRSKGDEEYYESIEEVKKFCEDKRDKYSAASLTAPANSDKTFSILGFKISRWWL